MRIINASLTLLLAISLFSCGSAGEEFFLEADGRGRVVADTDLSSMWGFMQMGLEQEMNNSDDKDPAQKAMLELLTAETFDTTFSFIEFVSNIAETQGAGPVGIMDLIDELESNPDMSQEDRETMVPLVAALSTTDLRLMGDGSSNKYGLATIQYFDDLSTVAPLGESFAKLAQMGAEQSGEEDSEELEMVSSMMGTATNYRLEGNTLYISRAPKEESDDMDPQMAMAMSMFGGSSDDFTLTLHLPGKIKKVSRDAEIDKRNGLVVVSMPAAEADAGFEFSVKFKPSRRR